MKQEEKDLLLKDLCGRLPYGVKVNVSIEEVNYVAVVQGVYADETVFVEQNPEPYKIHRVDVVHVSEIKPYLFPLPSMTAEQKEEWISLMIKDPFGVLYYTPESFDYLYKNHIDIRGLIGKGLAIDATGLNIYKEETK